MRNSLSIEQCGPLETVDEELETVELTGTADADMSVATLDVLLLDVVNHDFNLLKGTIF